MRTSRLGAIALLGSSLLTIAPQLARASDGNPDKPGFFTCSASAIRITFMGPLSPLGTIEPFAAGDADEHCQTAQSGLLQETTVGPVTISIIDANTEAHRRAAEAASQFLHLSVGPLEITLLQSEATAECQDNSQGHPTARRPILDGSAQLASVKLNGTELVPSAVNSPQTVTLPGGLGSVSLESEEEQSTTGRDRGGSITDQVLHVSTTLADVVLFESTADFHGQPCAPGQTKE